MHVLDILQSKLVGSLLAISCLFACSPQLNPVTSATPQAERQSFEKGFTALIEKEISANPNASTPTVEIKEIIETSEVLKISYALHYSESFSDGEKTRRATTGWALFKRPTPKSPWKIFKLQGAVQRVSFLKGTDILISANREQKNI